MKPHNLESLPPKVLTNTCNRFHDPAVDAPGVLPFSFLLAEGIEACALPCPTGKFAEAPPLQ